MYLAQITWPVLGQIDHASHSSTSLALSTIISTPFPCFLVSLYSSSTPYSERGIGIDGNREEEKRKVKERSHLGKDWHLLAKSPERRSPELHPASTQRTAAPTQHSRGAHAAHSGAHAALTRRPRNTHAARSGAHAAITRRRRGARRRRRGAQRRPRSTHAAPTRRTAAPTLQ